RYVSGGWKHEVDNGRRAAGTPDNHPSNSVFFFQAEDGIRDKLVTGVQTCALPISPRELELLMGGEELARADQLEPAFERAVLRRSEERRVGKSVDLGGGRIIKKKKEKNMNIAIETECNRNERNIIKAHVTCSRPDH